jgi:hypothetical protein
MEGASCCSPNRNANDDGCDQPIAPPAGHSYKSDFTCHIDVVVGGVALKQAVLEKENRPDFNITVIPNFILLTSSASLQAESHSHNLFLSKVVSPPSVDRYVLFDSFLI